MEMALSELVLLKGMSPEEIMQDQRFRDLHQSYLAITKYFTEITNRRNLLLEKKISPNNKEVELLSNLIESTLTKMDDWSKTFIDFRRANS